MDRTRLVRRLEHRLNSALLLLEDAAARGDLQAVAEHAAEARRRAGGLAAAALEPAGAIVQIDLRALILDAAPGASVGVPEGSMVAVPIEAAGHLVERLAAWMGPGSAWSGDGARLSVKAPDGAALPEATELGEPLIEYLVQRAGGELVAWAGDRAILSLPQA